MSTLKLAVQKSGRLREESLKLLKDCGIKVSGEDLQLRYLVPNFPLEILFLRNSDIPQYLEDGVADIGIVGENLLIEQEKNAEVIQPLGFSKCRVSMAAPREAKVPNTEYYRGKKIATSYPNTVSKFLQSKNIDAEIHTISGSVEIAPNIGLADGICDIVSTGSTLLKNGLVETEVILTSQAVLARSPELSSEKKALLEKLLFRIQAVLRAQNAKYILMNVPNEKIDAISNILPVLKSPTIMPLAEKGWSSLHSVIEEDTFWEVIDELKESGATDILVAPINKMVR